MNSILISISKIIAVPLVAVLTYAGYDVSPQAPLQNRIDSIEQQVQVVSQSKPKVILGGYNWSGGGTYRLQSSIGTTDTTIKLSSFKEPISGTAYTMANLNTSVAYGTLDPQNPTRSEFISFTGITQNADGTATLTGVTRGLSRSYPYTTSSTFKLTHSGQSIFILSDSPQHFAEYAVKQNDETITGDWKVPAPANATSIVNRNYVDGAAFGGIGGASETATGTVEIATGLEIASSTTNGTIGRLAIPASLATSTYNSATAPLKVVVTGNDGKIDTNFLSLSTLSNVTLTGNTTITGTTTLATSTASGTSNIASTSVVVFTSSGTWTKKPGLRNIVVELVGGGGGAADSTSNSGGAGGGGGGYSRKLILAASLGSTETVTVGSGGGQTVTGGTSSFGSHLSATGGAGGQTSNVPGGAGGSGSGGDINITGGGGGWGSGVTGTYGGNGGSSYFGGGAPGSNSGTNGGNYGGGGGGGYNTSDGGSGAAGIVIVTETYY